MQGIWGANLSAYDSFKQTSLVGARACLGVRNSNQTAVNYCGHTQLRAPTGAYALCGLCAVSQGFGVCQQLCLNLPSMPAGSSAYDRLGALFHMVGALKWCRYVSGKKLRSL